MPAHAPHPCRTWLGSDKDTFSFFSRFLIWMPTEGSDR